MAPQEWARRGRLVTFEGIDGAGKSTHIASVVSALQAQGLQVVATREPGGTALGEKLRELLLHESMHRETETLLMFAARREHLAQVIEPALARGQWVVSDRFTDATFAYQGGGRQVALEKLAALEQWVHPHLQPDLTFLFDLPLEVAKARLLAGRTLDKFEQEQADFFNATRAEYLRRAQNDSPRFRIIDANRHEIEVASSVTYCLSSFLREDALARKHGRTSAQMLLAPHRTTFVWCNSELAYPRALARHLDRQDIKVVPANYLKKPGITRDSDGSVMNVVIDHAWKRSHANFLL